MEIPKKIQLILKLEEESNQGFFKGTRRSFELASEKIKTSFPNYLKIGSLLTEREERER